MRPQGFPAQCLLCKVEVGNEEYNNVPKEWKYEQKYWKHYAHFKQVMENINTLHTRRVYVAVACMFPKNGHTSKNTGSIMVTLDRYRKYT